MSHVRTQIRLAIKAALDTALSSSEYDVYSSRKFNVNYEGKALVDMRFLNVNISQETMGDLRTHTGSLYIRCQRVATEEDLDDALDQDEILISNAVSTVDFSSLLEEDPELVQVNFTDDAETGSAVGGIILRYDVEYRIDKNDPETARG